MKKHLAAFLMYVVDEDMDEFVPEFLTFVEDHEDHQANAQWYGRGKEFLSKLEGKGPNSHKHINSLIK